MPHQHHYELAQEIISRLDSEGFREHSRAISEAIAAAGTSLEAIMAVRWTVAKYLERNEVWSEKTQALAMRLVTELDDLLSDSGPMKLRPDETEVVGRWIPDNGRMKADEACARIEHLTKKVLRKLGVSKYGAWETLYEDPADGRLWERTYPQSEMHGGGPPRLAVISREAARAKYGLPV